MKVYHLSILVVLSIWGCSKSATVPAMNQLELSSLDNTLIYDHLQSFPNGTQVAFAFVNGGKVQYRGVLREDDTLSAISNSNSVFEIGSISKVFTSILLAQLVNEGTLQLTESIKPYLRFDPPDTVDINFVSLSNHTSGLPRMPSNFTLSAILNQDNPYKNYDREKLQKYLTGSSLRLRTAGRYNYSNLGAGLLGLVMMEVTGEDYESLIQTRICTPMGLASTTTERQTILDRLVAGRDADGDVTSNWDLNALVAAGGILSTAEDMASFAIAQFDTTDRALALARQKTTNAFDNMDVGLGWHISYNEAGGTRHWHNGGTGGYKSYLAIDMQKERAVVVLTNVSAFHEDSRKVDQLGAALLTELSSSGTP